MLTHQNSLQIMGLDMRMKVNKKPTNTWDINTHQPPFNSFPHFLHICVFQEVLPLVFD